MREKNRMTRSRTRKELKLTIRMSAPPYRLLNLWAFAFLRNSEGGNPELYLPHTLRQELERRRRLPPDECVELGLRLTTALEHLHQNGLVHRDVKPSNIIFVRGTPKLADIGLVTEVGDGKSIVGTEGYLAPEGPGSASADLYSLGKVLYELSTGRDRRDFPDLPKDLQDSPQRQAFLELNEVLLKACANDSRQRYPSAAAMRGDLEMLQHGQSLIGKRTHQRRISSAKKMAVVLSAAVVVAALPFVNALKRGKAPSPEAVHLYELGRWHLSRLTDESMAKAIDYLNQAIKIDPKYVPAYVTLFEVYSWNPGGMSDADASQKISQIAEKLLEFDPNLGEGHTALAMAKFDEGDWQVGEEEIKKAIKLKPDYSLAHGIYGFYLALEGRPRESHQELEKAVRLDPESRSQATVAGYPYLVEQDYDGALRQFHKAIDLDPNFPVAHLYAGIALEAKDEYEEAIKEYQKFDVSAGEDPDKAAREYQALHRGFLDGGERGYWRKALELALARKAEASGKMFANDLWEIPGIYAQLGETNKALDLLEQDLIAGQLSVWLRVKPCFEVLRKEPRFKALLRKLGAKR